MNDLTQKDKTPRTNTLQIKGSELVFSPPKSHCLLFNQTLCCWYSQLDDSFELPQHMVWQPNKTIRTWKMSRTKSSEIIHFNRVYGRTGIYVSAFVKYTLRLVLLVYWYGQFHLVLTMFSTLFNTSYLYVSMFSSAGDRCMGEIVCAKKCRTKQYSIEI